MTFDQISQCLAPWYAYLAPRCAVDDGDARRVAPALLLLYASPRSPDLTKYHSTDPLLDPAPLTKLIAFVPVRNFGSAALYFYSSAVNQAKAFQ